MSTNPTDVIDNTRKYSNGPKTLRELRLYSAGQASGMRNLLMAWAANKSKTKAERAEFVKQARAFHWTYLARLREADGNPGYRSPTDVPQVFGVRMGRFAA